MPDETPAGGLPPDDTTAPAPSDAAPASEAGAAPDAAGAQTGDHAPTRTPGGYAYTVVDDDDAPAPAPSAGGGVRASGVHPLLLVAAAIIPAVIVGVAVWLLASSGGGSDKNRVNADVSNVVNAFTQAQGSTSTRYEGKLAPGYPDGLPAYPGATLLSSILQLRGQDASYLVIYDTPDARQKVSSYFRDKLAADPFQLDAAQDGRDSTLSQFSRIDDPQISGLVLSAESDKDTRTTIVTSVQVVSGAKNSALPSYNPGASKTLPDGFPDAVPSYPGAVIIESGYQKQAGARTFILSFVTKDEITKALDFYRAQLPNGGLTVTDGDASQSSLESAAAVQFTDAAKTLGGQVVAGKLAEDATYTRIDMQVRATPASRGAPAP